jgi:DNA polymerase III delta subunit
MENSNKNQSVASRWFTLVTSADFTRRNEVANIQELQLRELCQNEVVKLSSSSFSPATFEKMVVSPSLFSPKQGFIIKDVDELEKDAIKSLIVILKKWQPLLLAVGKSLPKSHPLVVLALKQSWINLPVLKDDELAKWLAERFMNLTGQKLSARLSSRIVELAEGNLDIAVQLLEQISLILDSSNLIEEVLAKSWNLTEFELIDMLSKAELPQVVAGINRLIEQGKNPFGFIGLLFRTLTNYLAVRELLDSGMIPAKIQSQLGLSPWLFKKYLQGLGNKSAKSLHDSVIAVLKASQKLRNANVGVESVIEELIWTLR